MATRGRPKGVETRVLHVRIPVTLHEQLDNLQFATQKTTSDVVRELLDRYVLAHSALLDEIAKARADATRRWSAAEIEAQERGQLENDEEAAKPENGSDGEDD
ncbi:hypothetical protein GWK53_24485 [Burkholderia cepacia]|uniref:hypothetical protein n=1 Tax=Burkholderia cepacia TaxID=292 RepID=UPI0013F45176|nr:hypothetical protein [Burkholderia cepacia]NHB09644.1 hypothetical protein [Burkholderia cepacia]